MRIYSCFITNSSTASFVAVGFLLKPEDIPIVINRMKVLLLDLNVPESGLTDFLLEILDDYLRTIPGLNIITSSDFGLPSGYEMAVAIDIGSMTEEDPEEIIKPLNDLLTYLTSIKYVLGDKFEPQIIFSQRMC